jgi:hypothetical protein
VSNYNRDVAIAIGYHFWQVDTDDRAEYCGADAAKAVARRFDPIGLDIERQAIQAEHDDLRAQLAAARAEGEAMKRKADMWEHSACEGQALLLRAEAQRDRYAEALRGILDRDEVLFGDTMHEYRWQRAIARAALKEGET